MALTKVGKEGITGISNSSDANAITIDSSERVMIGTTTEGEGSADDLTVASTGNTGITIRAGTSNSSSIYMSDATSGAGEYAGYIAYSHSSDAMAFGASGGQRIRVDSDGLKFGSDTAAANALDDYEEGVGTVTFSALSGGSVTINTSYNTLSYTKIGRLVHIQGEVRISSVSSPSGFMRLNNLPFASATGGTQLSDRVYGSLLWYDSSAATYNNIGGTIVANSQSMTLTGESGGSFQFGANDSVAFGFSYNTQ